MLGASGLQTAALPTAILSTHTGGFGENTFLDLSASLPDIWAHWDKENISFDAIYLGYLGQAASRVWEKGLEEYSRQGKLILLDPAMADHGRLYRGFDDSYVVQMQLLARQATILTPNLTEALLLLNEPVDFTEVDSHRACVITQRLAQKFALSQVVLTGVSLADNRIGVYGLSRGGRVWERTQSGFRTAILARGTFLPAASWPACFTGWTWNRRLAWPGTSWPRQSWQLIWTRTSALALITRRPCLGFCSNCTISALIIYLKEEK
ncbi:pyridoxal kinase [Lactobacillus delbrueckii subsp. bulgaricus ATCC 11842 = JCM 1002]|nr:pyridoxal kinase [Lactobacillus delbrueckii subsp. bulgaricus ATCC 11842 = JCM 1002]